MDVVLEYSDEYVFDAAYELVGGVLPVADLPRDNLFRISLSMYIITALGGLFFYFFFATLNYLFVYDKTYMSHDKFLKNQVRREITLAATSIPIMAIVTAPLFVGEVLGYSQLHDEFNGWTSIAVSMLLFLLFTDMCVYWIHRWLHHPKLYHFHKPHHLWKVSTPFASHAFHPVDGFAQGFPYHLYVYLFPMNKYLYIFMFVFVNVWTISIHDGSYVMPGSIINTAAHHTDHHLFFNYNYGQYFTLWDRIGGSFRKPSVEDNNYVLEEAKKAKKAKSS